MKIIALRLRGRVDVPERIERTLTQLGLKKKFSCTVIEDKPELKGMIKKVKSYIAFGSMEEETLKQLLLKRAKKGRKRADLDEKQIDAFVKDFMQGKAGFDKIEINKTFALHPARGGFKKSLKLEYPQGLLGKNKEINKLILKML